MAWNRKPKVKVLEVVNSDGTVVAYYAKGRFTPTEFHTAVEQHLGKKTEGLERSKQEFWCNGTGEEIGLDVRFHKCTVFTPGAYAVTVLDLEPWAR